MFAKDGYHYLEWDEAKVAKFWDFAASWEAWQDDYFSKQVGAGIVNFLRYVVPLNGRILDYGCGPGYLAEHLLKAGIRCEAVDSSPESVEVVNQKFSANSLWGGAQLFAGERLPFPDDTFDLIICIETIEHVLPVHMNAMLSELHRILKPENGRLFITTPNSENLDRNMVCCPECCNVFHRVQHVSSFTPKSLEILLNNHSFHTIFCNITDFGRFQQSNRKILDWNLRYLLYRARHLLAGTLDGINLQSSKFGSRQFLRFIGRGSHLFWIGTKFNDRK